MKSSKDVVNGQPSQTYFQNLINLLLNDFPGLTHVAISVPINPSIDFLQYGNTPSPLTVEAFTDMLLDVIHNAGYKALIRGTDCYGEGIYNFPYKPQTAQQWLNEVSPYLTLHKAHLKSGDVIGLFPEFEGQNNGFGKNVTDSWEGFYEGLINTVNTWGTENGIPLISYTTINESEASSGWYNESIVKAQGAFVVDYYPPSSIVDEENWITNAKNTIDDLYNKYGSKSFPVFLQEIGDTRNPQSGNTQANNPQLTGDLFTQVIVPYLKSGELIGINLWCLFDTPQEGILTIDGNSVSLNPKGQALSNAFKTASGMPTPVPTPVPTPTPIPTPVPPTVPPTFEQAITAGTITSDGQGNITISLKV